MINRKSVIFEGDDLKVTLSENETSDTLVYSFGGFNKHRVAESGFGEGFLDGCGYSSVFFIAKRNCWWQTPEMTRAIEAIRRLDRARYVHRVCYGASMGGYGALLHAGELDATRVLACSPQTIVSDANYPMHADWLAFMRGVPILREDIPDCIPAATSVAILFDPLDRMDRRHVGRLAGLTGMETFCAPLSGHFSLEFLRECGVIGILVPQILAGTLTPAEFRRTIRLHRLKSEVYRTNFKKRNADHSRRIAMIDRRMLARLA